MEINDETLYDRYLKEHEEDALRVLIERFREKLTLFIYGKNLRYGQGRRYHDGLLCGGCNRMVHIPQKEQLQDMALFDRTQQGKIVSLLKVRARPDR